ncbi:MAG: MMPL family transporter [Bifidobacteriaceae bacterium]|jgi:RND superfamily putative drug exporter|nr:MMPL family transporter [Bifidobacteriaceae bacterium]
MAEFLYRLGKAAARRAILVIVSWAALVGIAGAGYLLGHGALAPSFDIPGLPSSQVVDQLAEELPEYAGATGTIVVATTSGAPFTETQRAQISEAVASAPTLPDVAQVTDPFTAEAQRQDQVDQLAQGATALDEARADLDAGQAALDQAAAELDQNEQQIQAGLQQLDQGQAALDAAIAQATEANGPAAAMNPAFQAQQAELDAKRAELEAGQAGITQGRTQLETQAAQLADGLTQIEAQGAQLQAAQELVSLAEPIRLISEDEAAAQIPISFTEPRMDLASSSKTAAIEHFTEAGIDGVEVAVSVEMSQDVPDVLGWGEAVGLALAAVVLVIMFRALAPTLVPVIGAVTGVGVAALGGLAFSSVVTMTSVTPILAVMLGLAVGVDYSLFIINRHRRMLAAGAPLAEAIGLANGTSGTAVVFAGGTVVVALAALGVTGIPFLALMGAMGAAAVAVAVAVAVTLTPAILGLIGRRVLPHRLREADPVPVPEVGQAAKAWVGIVRAVVAVCALGVLAIPALDIRLGLPDGSSEPPGSLAERAHALTAAEFSPGANGMLLVTAELEDTLDDAARTTTQLEVAAALGAQAGVVGVAPVGISESGHLAAFQVLPEGGPNDESTADLVGRLRALEVDAVGGPLGVAGQAAINIDISDRLADAMPLYLGVVVGLSLVILAIVFRSLLVPLIAAGGFILSLFATLGVITAIFQWGWVKALFGLHATGPVLNFLPVLLAGVLFGLAMDYQIFLAAGMREAYVHGIEARRAVAVGFRAGRPVVIAAALIMVAIFGGFVFAESTIIKSVGLGLALGVALDAFIVRLVLMPALMSLMGRAAWWLPKWLDRLIPRADVEGAALSRRHAAL